MEERKLERGIETKAYHLQVTLKVSLAPLFSKNAMFQQSLYFILISSTSNYFWV